MNKMIFFTVELFSNSIMLQFYLCIASYSFSSDIISSCEPSKSISNESFGFSVISRQNKTLLIFFQIFKFFKFQNWNSQIPSQRSSLVPPFSTSLGMKQFPPYRKGAVYTSFSVYKQKHIVIQNFHPKLCRLMKPFWNGVSA
jgi:hypothetical protein